MMSVQIKGKIIEIFFLNFFPTQLAVNVLTPSADIQL